MTRTGGGAGFFVFDHTSIDDRADDRVQTEAGRIFARTGSCIARVTGVRAASRNPARIVLAASVACVLGLAPIPAMATKLVDGAAGSVSVEVTGAVAKSGAVSLAGPSATVDDALGGAGGVGVDAYRFALLLLRPVAESPARFPCVTPGARHAALLIGDDPVLRAQNDLVARLRDGRVQRLFAQQGAFGRLGSDRGGSMMLRSGDVLALPQRSGRVYVIAMDGRVESVVHDPRLTADDYLDQLPSERVVRRRDYVLHYPDGHVTELMLEGWNAEPTVVPPGSMLAPAAGCLPVIE